MFYNKPIDFGYNVALVKYYINPKKAVNGLQFIVSIRSQYFCRSFNLSNLESLYLDVLT